MMSALDYQLFYQRHLPHYQPPGAILFITFRLAGTLPREVIQRLKEEIRRHQDEIERITGEQNRQQAVDLARKKLFARWDAVLDIARHGPRWLENPTVAAMVCDALHHRDGDAYTLEAYCVMPNHVHLVCTPRVDDSETVSLSRIMHSLKGYTARQANLLLQRSGAFWQHESYDHVVRDSAELERIVAYVLDNPVRAGLPARWVYSRSSRLS